MLELYNKKKPRLEKSRGFVNDLFVLILLKQIRESQ